MTQEQEQLKKLSALADDYSQQPHRQRNFLAGAQTILENPADWGLCSLEALQRINKLKAENERYREAMKKASDFAFHLSEPVYEIVDILEEAIDGRE